MKMQEQVNRKDVDLKHAKLMLHSMEGKLKRIEDLEREIAQMKTTHAEAIGKL